MEIEVSFIIGSYFIFEVPFYSFGIHSTLATGTSVGDPIVVVSSEEDVTFTYSISDSSNCSSFFEIVDSLVGQISVVENNTPAATYHCVVMATS